MTQFKNRTSILRYGVGCELHDNCFSCEEQPDCHCKNRADRAHVMTDESIIWGGNPEKTKIRYLNMGVI